MVGKLINVGKSQRTPAKHKLLNKIAGEEIGVSWKNSYIHNLIFLDHTAGDGLAEGEWRYNCTPGILAFHASKSTKPIRVLLYEINEGSFVHLLKVLLIQLPLLGYRQVNRTTWTIDGKDVYISVLNSSGAEIDLSTLLIDEYTSVLSFNDPNAVSQWAIRPTFAQEIHRRTGLYRSVSTAGCNPGGLKRILLKYPEEGLRWQSQLESLTNAMPGYHDMLLAVIDGDQSQWAYFIETSDKWREKTEKAAEKSFGIYGYRLRMAWLELDKVLFWQMTDILFSVKPKGNRARCEKCRITDVRFKYCGYPPGICPQKTGEVTI